MSVTAQSETRNVDRILAFTRDSIEREVKDQSFNHSPLLAAFTGKLLGEYGSDGVAGRAKQVQSGAESIVVRMNLGKNTGAKRKSGPWDTNETAPSDTVRNSRANWKFYSVPVTLSDHEVRVNVGPEALSSVAKHEAGNAMRSLGDLIATDAYDDNGIATAVLGMDSLISANDAVQGLSGATYADFNSRGVSARGTVASAVSFAGGSFTAVGLENMRIAWNNASEGSIQPNAIFTTWDAFAFYESRLQAQERYTNTSKADGGFTQLAFKSAPIFPDAYCPSGSMFFVNWDSIKLVALSGADFNMGDFVRVQNQSARVAQIEFTGNVVIQSRRFLNKLTGIVA